MINADLTPVYRVIIPNRKDILATNKELVLLRQCFEVMANHQQSVVTITACRESICAFLVRTLLHLGVSSAQIAVNLINSASDPNENSQTELVVSA